ncbi:MAG: hypothetical protein P4L52_02545 [Acidocella sp.]|nr:hypothetical protein [Acidocella sp.]
MQIAEKQGVCAAVVARDDATPIFELGEHVLDFMALAVKGFAIVQCQLAAFGRQDAWGGTSLGDERRNLGQAV